MPEEAQLKFLHKIKGLEQVRMVKPAYVVDYDYIDPKQSIRHTLETKQVPGLYLAG